MLENTIIYKEILILFIMVVSLSAFYTIVTLVIIWEIAWKLVAMWKAAKYNAPAWFIILAVISTLGILPILYIYVFSEMKKKSSKKKSRKKR